MKISLPGQGEIDSDSASEGFSDHETSFSVAFSDIASVVNQTVKQQTPYPLLDITHVVIHDSDINDAPHLYQYITTSYDVGPTLVVQCITTPRVIHVPYGRLKSLLPVDLLRDEPRIPVVGGNAVLVNSWVRFTLSPDCPAYSRAHDSVGEIVKFLGYVRRYGETSAIFGHARGGTTFVPMEHISSLRFVR
jgi:hypothetical protein